MANSVRKRKAHRGSGAKFQTLYRGRVSPYVRVDYGSRERFDQFIFAFCSRKYMTFAEIDNRAII